ncbi:MAG: glycine zipper 2TM domain-containing protein [Rhodospirillaceae bacterium]|nr:glycine zipper 2TM domain-containing protein [Rhodospirillaceae bacterium]MDE0617654.1 glycine zipper 2TM domain-containing protein [Rhodospirillaceae bacterium]
MRNTFLAVGLSAALVLAGCTANKEMAGAAGGAVIGGLAGAALARKGDTSGRLAGAAIGGLVGGFIGSRIGAALDRKDREMADSNAQEAMERGRTGRRHGWRNKRSGNRGFVTPTSPPYRFKDRRGRVWRCRNFTETTELSDGRTETVEGRRCRTKGRPWSVVAT